MTERERLIELVDKAKEEYANDVTDHTETEYIVECLLDNGVIVPPCKVGDSCYPLPRYRTPLVERKISRITYSKRNVIIGYYENDGQYRPPLRTRILGEDVFLAREEAEKALAEKQGKDEGK
jgi:hypothetical protein